MLRWKAIAETVLFVLSVAFLIGFLFAVIFLWVAWLREVRF